MGLGSLGWAVLGPAWALREGELGGAGGSRAGGLGGRAQAGAVCLTRDLGQQVFCQYIDTGLDHAVVTGSQDRCHPALRLKVGVHLEDRQPCSDVIGAARST